MAILYSIKAWDDLFEVSQSRRNKGPLDWVAIPTKHDGKGYRRVARLPNAATVFAAWVLILQVAGKCRVHGVLADEDGPLDAADLEDKTCFPAEMFCEAFKALTDKKIGWIIAEEVGERSEDAPSAVGARSFHERTNKQDEQDEQTNKTNIHDRTNERTNEEATGTGDHEEAVLKKAEAVEAAVLKAIPCPTKDRPFIRKCALAAASGKIPEQWVISAANGAKETKADKPIAYFTSLLQGSCKDGRFDFKNILRAKLPDRWGTGPPVVTMRVNQPPAAESKTAHDVLKELEAATKKP